MTTVSRALHPCLSLRSHPEIAGDDATLRSASRNSHVCQTIIRNYILRVNVLYTASNVGKLRRCVYKTSRVPVVIGTLLRIPVDRRRRAVNRISIRSGGIEWDGPRTRAPAVVAVVIRTACMQLSSPTPRAAAAAARVADKADVMHILCRPESRTAWFLHQIVGAPRRQMPCIRACWRTYTICAAAGARRCTCAISVLGCRST